MCFSDHNVLFRDVAEQRFRKKKTMSTNPVGLIKHRCAPREKTYVFQKSAFVRLFFKVFFTARRVCYAQRGLCRRKMSVSLSVRLSYAGVVSKWYISSKFFRHWVARPFQIFQTKRDGIFRRGPPNGGGASNARGYEKITIVDQYLALSRKRCQIVPSCYGRRIGNHTQAFEWYQFE